MPRPTFGLLRLPPHEELMDDVVYVLAAVIGMEVLDAERKQLECRLQCGLHAFLADLLHGDDHLPLCHLVHEIYVIDALILAEIPLMNGIHPEEARSPVRFRFPALSDIPLRSLRFLDRERFFPVPVMLTQTVDLRRGNTA